MMMDKTGTSLFFGSEHELMIYNAVANTLTTQNTNAPGVVLAVSPNGQQVLVNDQVLGKFYLVTVSGGSEMIFGGMGTAAAWTPDSKTLYITDSAAAGGNHTNTLYVYNVNTGWASCSAGSACASDFKGAMNLAVTVPGVGAYFSGSSTVSRTWCPAGTVGDSTDMIFYPEGDIVPVQTDTLAATADGKHILGAAYNAGTGNVTLADIGVSIPTTVCPGVGANAPAIGGTIKALSTGGALNQALPVSVTASSVNQVVTSPQSSLAFITYNGTATGAGLPFYVPGSGATTVNNLTLSDCSDVLASGLPNPAYPCNSTIVAPVAGAFAPDDSYFFVSTAGDNMVHYISVANVLYNLANPTTPINPDVQQISPNLPACTATIEAGCKNLTVPAGDPVPATVIAVRPRATT
jgi:hypothetical protein